MSGRHIVLAIGLGAGVAVAYLALTIRKRHRARATTSTPSTPCDFGERLPLGSTCAVRSLHAYPVKSCAGIAPARALQIDEWGAVDDRRFMVYRDGTTPTFVTQRQLPLMALIETSVTRSGETLVLSFRWRKAGAAGLRDLLWGLLPPHAPAEHVLRVDTRATTTLPVVRVVIWDDTIDAFDMGDAVSAWLSQGLACKVRLCWTGVHFQRPVSAALVPQYALRAESALPQTAFSDGYPLLLIGSASLERLNAAMALAGEPRLPMDRFRPNIVVDTSEPFEEDRWKRIRIGSAEFAVVKSCSRCKITTIDQASATPTRPTDGSLGLGEPHTTLKKFRKYRDGLYFGQNVILIGVTATIEQGAEVTVLERGEPTFDEAPQRLE